MLVTVAVLVIMMTILVQIFQAATGSVSAAQAYQALDDQLRRLDGIIRSDLEGATARFTPPLDPAQNLGYFEYGENEFADNQGEDTDDYFRFTAKAPSGRPFTGRMFIPPSQAMLASVGSQLSAARLATYLGAQPITITSDYAEIIYFVRNGNLYRRVFLIAPELQSAIVPAIANQGYYQLPAAANATSFAFQPSLFGGPTTSWQGVNDLSAHPAPSGPNANATTSTLAQAQATIVLNTLGHLTNRENRAFYPRFANDFFNADPATQKMSTSTPDGIPDDVNQDNVPDLYPSLYPGLFVSGAGGTGPPHDAFTGNSINPLIFEPNGGGWVRQGINFLAFPYVFPGAYSKAQTVAHDAYGWIHAPTPQANVNGTLVQFDTGSSDGTYTPLDYLNHINHNPIDVGDNLLSGAQVQASQQTTWWGFPTWRETMSPGWTDPTVQVNIGPDLVSAASPSQPMGFGSGFTWTYGSLNLSGGVMNLVAANGTTPDPNLLPPMRDPGGLSVPFAIFRPVQDPYSDAAGGGSAFWGGATTTQSPLWAVTWEDDLIMTNVRSFDVKAYDNALADYGDLGWGDDLRLYQPFSSLHGAFIPATPPAIAGTPTNLAWPPINPATVPTTPVYSTVQTMAHEGRMPPLVSDLRFDAQFGASRYTGFTYTGNVGDDNSSIVRLRRVWDTWSTDYSRAPATGVDTFTSNGFPHGPPFSPPIYPSYPPPYPAPLRGLQIKIRVADPTNQRVKSLTIRQDFTDKL